MKEYAFCYVAECHRSYKRCLAANPLRLKVLTCKETFDQLFNCLRGYEFVLCCKFHLRIFILYSRTRSFIKFQTLTILTTNLFVRQCVCLSNLRRDLFHRNGSQSFLH